MIERWVKIVARKKSESELLGELLEGFEDLNTLLAGLLAINAAESQGQPVRKNLNVVYCWFECVNHSGSVGNDSKLCRCCSTFHPNEEEGSKTW